VTAKARPISKQIASVKHEFMRRPQGLIDHVERVLVEALDLARRWDVDPRRTELAVWGHDLFRAHPPAEQLRLAAEAGLTVTADDARNPVMLHGPLGAAFLETRFGVADAEVLDAVRLHTTGSAEMPLLAKLILLADKVERRKRKRAAALASIRLAARRDIDTALLCWADWKWVDERERGWESYPAHWAARTRWVAEHHQEIALPGRVGDEEYLAAALLEL
jgi:predicted HD superfamily hydrolase involved in NAD metabolism